METRQICPKCRKQYPGHEIVCEECGEKLAEISAHCEEYFYMVKDPVLLSNGHGVDIPLLEEELKKRDVPYYMEEGQNAVPANHIKKGLMQMVSYHNFYVDKSRWKAAKEALGCARKEETKAPGGPGIIVDRPGGASGGGLSKKSAIKTRASEKHTIKTQTPERYAANIQMPERHAANIQTPEQDGQDGREQDREEDRSLWTRFMDQEIYIRLGMIVVVVVFILGFVKVIMS